MGETAKPPDGEPAGERRNTPAHIKRFLERFVADPGFQDLARRDAPAAARQIGALVDPEVVRPLWDGEWAATVQAGLDPATGGPAVPEPALRYREIFKEKVAMRDRVRQECAPREPRFRAWRQRQIARTDQQFSPGVNAQIVHSPFNLELCRGCSVGCWFCGCDAPKLAEVFPYTPENAELFRSVLRVMDDLCGPAARHAFLYWATEPLDNPDYEKFCGDFADILGIHPMTTTAVPLRDPRRTRDLLRTSRARGAEVNRFSVLSLEMLSKIHAEFSPEELLHVECLALNREADMLKANAGRFREAGAKDPGILTREMAKARGKVKVVGGPGAPPMTPEQAQAAAMPTSIACVSGFLMNLCERTVRLISPCRADDRWPLGYMVFEEGRFEDAAGLVLLLEGMIRRNMPHSVPEGKPVRLRRDLRVEHVPGGVAFTTPFQHVKFVNSPSEEYLRDLGDYLLRGEQTPSELGLIGLYSRGMPPESTQATLDAMLRRGLIDEEPPPPHG